MLYYEIRYEYGVDEDSGVAYAGKKIKDGVIKDTPEERRKLIDTNFNTENTSDDLKNDINRFINGETREVSFFGWFEVSYNDFVHIKLYTHEEKLEHLKEEYYIKYTRLNELFQEASNNV